MAKAKIETTMARGLTRAALAKALGCSARKVDRLIAAGLAPCGRRGAAKVYRLSDARRLVRRLAPVESVAADVLVADYATQTEDLADRLRSIRETWISRADLQAVWQPALARVQEYTASWPATFSDRIGGLSPDDDPIFLASADGPIVQPARPVHVSAAEWQAQRPPRTAPMLRPALEGLVDMVGVDPAWAALGDTLERVTPPPALAAPESVDAARAVWRSMRALHRTGRVLVRRGHVRRAAVTDRIAEAAEAFKWRWWRAVPAIVLAHAGDRTAALRALDHLRSDTLAHFAQAVPS